MGKNPSKTGWFFRTLFLVIWALVVILGIGSYIADPGAFTAEHIADFIGRFHGMIWVIYSAFSILRGLTLLPSTPLVLAGTLVFPDEPFSVLVVSITGILLSSTMIYFGSDYLGFSDYFEGHKPELSNRIKTKLEHPLGEVFVAAWAFFPFVPTDLVCYLAGTTRMKYWKFIAAIFVGEMALCICYIFFGGSLLKYGK